jgi:branched-subunit amino acid aminotransferase/4-amino-4-deoxychorismate lyase
VSSADYALIETLRWSRAQGYLRLPAHLRRLEASARCLRFCLDPAAATARLTELLAVHPPTADFRAHLILRADGDLELTAEPIPDIPAPPARLLVSRHVLDERDPLLSHKTTARATHERAAAEAAAAGRDEAVLLNSRGLVAGGTRSTVFAETAEGFVTPRLEDGALPGVLREVLLTAGRARAGPLTLADLRNAPHLYIGGSARGLQPARLVG